MKKMSIIPILLLMQISCVRDSVDNSRDFQEAILENWQRYQYYDFYKTSRQHVVSDEIFPKFDTIYFKDEISLMSHYPKRGAKYNFISIPKGSIGIPNECDEYVCKLYVFSIDGSIFLDSGFITRDHLVSIKYPYSDDLKVLFYNAFTENLSRSKRNICERYNISEDFLDSLILIDLARYNSNN
ncbi:MAG: hypothetical protein JNM57_02990 [Cyclobacteriaceae bacterium]|nr:hypothetical protein [Cyclobacteriaceae bacterium]